ncbi:MAG: hypothetical protein AB1568_17280 [Thermodesulfobacteriota bacterium]
MGHHSSNPYGTDQRVSDAIDRQREQERHHMLQQAYRQADTLATKLVQRLIDQKVLDITSEEAIRDVFSALLKRLSTMDDFDVQFKIAPLRSLVPNPNFLSLYLTQYITEDLIDHPKVQDVFGDDLEIYQAVDSVLAVTRQR